MNNIDIKNKLIKSYFEVEENEYVFDEKYNELAVNGANYLILTDEEANDLAYNWIKESVWAFKSELLEELTSMDAEVFEVLQEKYEGANDAILKVIESTCGLDTFVETVIKYEGRGYFISFYDGNEECIKLDDNDLFIYRV